MYVLNVMETTQVNIVRVRQVASSLVKGVTFLGSARRINRVVEIQATELNLHKLLHQIGLHLEDPLLVPAKGQTATKQSLAANRKITLQMFSRV